MQADKVALETPEIYRGRRDLLCFLGQAWAGLGKLGQIKVTNTKKITL